MLADHAAFIDARASAFSTSSSWLGAAADFLPTEPVVVTVRSAGELAGLAALGVTQRVRLRSITMLGGELNDYTQFFVAGDDAVAGLAFAVADWVSSHRWWSLSLGQLPAGDPVLAALAALLPRAAIEPGAEMPRIEGLKDGYAVNRNRRGKVRNAMNRMTTDGRACERLTITDPDLLAHWLPRVIDVRRERDHGVGRRSQLDDPGTCAFYGHVVAEAVRSGRGQVNLVLIDGAVGAYTIVMADGSTHRLFDGRVANDLQHYWGGLVANMMAVTNAIEAPGVDTFDWLRGKSIDKFGTAELRREGLRATSHRLVSSVDVGRAALKAKVKDALPDEVLRRLASR